MESQYLKLYKHHSATYGPNTCIFYKVGKFYEMYDSLNPETGEGNTSLQAAVELLNIQLSTKQDHGKTTFFAGVPEQSLHKYAAVLTRQNWTVVVCDQMKDASGKVTDRPVVRILSPGTHSEISTTDSCFVAFLWLEERHYLQNESPAFGVTFFDMTTGITTGFQDTTTGTADIWTADSLVHSIQIYNPREIVIGWRGTEISRPNEPTLRSRIGGTQALLHIRYVNSNDQGGFEKSLVREDFLLRLYSPKTMIPILDYLHIRTSPLVERSLIGLLRFMEDHFAGTLENLRGFEPWLSAKHVHLGNNTLTQFNMTSLQSNDCVLGMFTKTITAPGKRGMRTRILTPIYDIHTLTARYDKIEFLNSENTKLITTIEKHLRQICDFPRIYRRIATFSVNAADILQLEQTFCHIQELAVSMRETLFAMSLEQFEQFLHMRSLFSSLFDVEKARRSDEDCFFLQDSAAPNTAKIEAAIAALREGLVKSLHELEIWSGIPPDSLRIESNRETQVFSVLGNKKELNILKKALNEKGDLSPIQNAEVVLKKTGGGSLEYPALGELHVRVSSLRSKLASAAKEELCALCTQFLTPVDVTDILWKQLEEWVADIDITLAIALLSKQRAFVRPILANATHGAIEITGLRHPLIESTALRVPYVQHMVKIGYEQTGWLVYGMNASGKSSLMKAVGIAVLLAQTGCFVPAVSMTLSPFHAILTRILNQDNLWAGLSSFAVEMTELRDILYRADKFSLVLGDELCSGTESVSATALVAAGVTHLLKKEARFIFATHLHGLMELPALTHTKALGVRHLKVSYDPVKDILIFDRTLQEGPGSSIYGIEVARALHLPPEFLESAITIRKSILGQKTEEEISPSTWNSNIVRRSCAVCGHSITDDLEVHHIRPRASATDTHHFQDGSDRDAVSNLIVVCKECHTRHHSGEIAIQPAVQTSDGLFQPVTFNSPENTTLPADDQRAIILDTLQKKPNVPLVRIVYDLQLNHQINVTEATLRKYRKTKLTVASAPAQQPS